MLVCVLLLDHEKIQCTYCKCIRFTPDCRLSTVGIGRITELLCTKAMYYFIALHFLSTNCFLNL